jgi:hypothetical protein
VEPVSGFEPLTCRLQEARPRALSALAAPMTQVIALTAPAALGLFGASSHEPFHADGEKQVAPVTERSDQNLPKRRRNLLTCSTGQSNRSRRIGRCIAESSRSLDQGGALRAPLARRQRRALP